MIQGLDQDSRSETFKPIVVPDGTYMTQIACHLDAAFAIDNDHNLWMWGNIDVGQF